MAITDLLSNKREWYKKRSDSDDFRAPKRHDDIVTYTCTAGAKSSMKTQKQSNFQLNLNYSNPNLTAVFSSVQSSKSLGRVIIVDIYTTVVKILAGKLL